MQEQHVSDLWWHAVNITRLSHPSAELVSVGATRAAVYHCAGDRLTAIERKALQSALVQNAGGLKESDPLVDYTIFWRIVQTFGGTEGVTVRDRSCPESDGHSLPKMYFPWGVPRQRPEDSKIPSPPSSTSPEGVRAWPQLSVAE